MRKIKIMLIFFVLCLFIFTGCNTFSYTYVKQLKGEMINVMKKQNFYSDSIENIFLIGKYGDGMVFVSYTSTSNSEYYDEQFGDVIIRRSRKNSNLYYYIDDSVCYLNDIYLQGVLIDKDIIKINKIFKKNNYLIDEDLSLKNSLISYCRHKNRYTESELSTCISNGIKRLYCKDCGELLNEILLDISLHSYVDESCIYCKQKEYIINDDCLSNEEVLSCNNQFVSVIDFLCGFINECKDKIYVYVLQTKEKQENMINQKIIEGVSFCTLFNEEIYVFQKTNEKVKYFTLEEAFENKFLNKNMLLNVQEKYFSQNNCDKYAKELLINQNLFVYENMENIFLYEDYNANYQRYSNMVNSYANEIYHLYYPKYNPKTYHFKTDIFITYIGDVNIGFMKNVKIREMNFMKTYQLEELSFKTIIGANLIVEKNGMIYNIDEAYEKNIISYNDIKRIYEKINEIIK